MEIGKMSVFINIDFIHHFIHIKLHCNLKRLPCTTAIDKPLLWQLCCLT